MSLNYDQSFYVNILIFFKNSKHVACSNQSVQLNKLDDVTNEGSTARAPGIDQSRLDFHSLT